MGHSEDALQEHSTVSVAASDSTEISSVAVISVGVPSIIRRLLGSQWKPRPRLTGRVYASVAPAQKPFTRRQLSGTNGAIPAEWKQRDS